MSVFIGMPAWQGSRSRAMTQDCVLQSTCTCSDHEVNGSLSRCLLCDCVTIIVTEKMLLLLAGVPKIYSVKHKTSAVIILYT